MVASICAARVDRAINQRLALIPLRKTFCLPSFGEVHGQATRNGIFRRGDRPPKRAACATGDQTQKNRRQERRQPRPEVASLQKSSDRPTAWWVRQGSNL